MKKFYYSLILTIFCIALNAQTPFITKWQITSPNTAVNFNITTDITPYTINFGDGTPPYSSIDAVSHVYANTGIYTVTITGSLRYSNFHNQQNLISIEQWGSGAWEFLHFSFSECENLVVNATDAPNLSLITNLESMFANSPLVNQPFNNWNISNVEKLDSMLSGTSYNQPLSNWNVSNVTSMRWLFFDTPFNQPINNWNVSNTTDFSGLFDKAINFNQPLNNWDVSSAMRLAEMFEDAVSFNQNIDNWNVSNVIDLGAMFNNATAFNQPLNSWDVSNVISMLLMFSNATSFNQPLNNWQINDNNYLGSTFKGASNFNQDISGWNFTQESLNTFSDYPSEIVRDSGLNSINYDKLLLRFAQLGFQNQYFNGGGLEYCDTGVRNYLINNLQWSINGDSLNAECFGNTILGNVRYDQNNNGCDVNDIAMHSFLVRASNGNYNYTSLTNNSGIYNLKVLDASYNVGLVNVPNYFTVNPASTTLSFTDFGNTENLNFCLTSNQTVNDLNVTVLPVTEARPGFQAEYQLVVQNMGTQNVVNATVVLNYNVTKQTFVSAVPNTSAATSGQLTFSFANLQSLQSKIVDFKMQTLVPPIVNGGDVLNFTATVTPNTADATPQDNTFVLEQIAVNSYDPNDKQVLQGDQILISEASQYLDYIIRFQNTGSASAITVRIEDMLHENLDWNTLRMVSASHNYRVQITDGNKVDFIFDNINLPHEAADALGSNGFIAYKIKPKTSIQVGDVMSGNAAIFFDYNLPIITNVVSTEVVQQLSTPEFSSSSIRVYPNPTDGKVYLQANNGAIIESATLFSLQGKKLLHFTDADTVNIERLSAGIYLLEVTTNVGRSNYKIIKK